MAQLTPAAKSMIVKQIERSLRPRGGKLVNREGELKEWFIRKLDCIVPMAMVKDDPDIYLVVLSLVRNRSCESLAKQFSHNGVKISPRTLRYRRRQVLESAVDMMPPRMAQGILIYALGESRYRLKGCKKCGGDQYLEIESPWGSGHRDYGKRAWICFSCGKDEPIE